MAVFDPKQHKGKGFEAIPAGPYLLAMKDFDRKMSKAGNPYLHVKWVIIVGAAKKRTFYDNMSLDLTSSGAMGRLSLYAEQCGQTEAFDLDDDRAIRAAFVGRPFKAMLSCTQSNGYTNNGIARLLVGDAITSADREAMNAWVTEQAESSEWSGGDDRDVPPPSDDDFASGGPGWGSQSSSKNDDNIPFATCDVSYEPSPIARILR